ncbi:hypothetical protein B296_00022650 [Ensete ventricosum]|uniref:Transposase (putative) gypsy type domain-containing protein n=1 Tax=Ensete ventricosum TaxID=4639 RepID=A0A426XF32_ENSVE|nr:hypothetical protein B296_00022650 [Ensete ventricosum]
MSNRRLLVSAIRWISFQKAHLQAHGDGKNKEHPAHAQVPAFSEWLRDVDLAHLTCVRSSLPRGRGGVSQGDLEASSLRASSGLSSRVDARVLRDLEVMKVDHDLDTAVTEGSLAVIRGQYNISTEYGLHVPRPEQRPYSSDTPDMCISVDALEVGLRFPLHPLIKECLRWWRISPSQIAPNSWRYLVVFLGECRGTEIIPTRDLFMASREVGVSPARETPKVSSKRLIDASTEQVDDPARWHKKVKVLTRRHKSRHDEGESRSHSKGKEPTTPSEELETPVESDEGGASPVHHRPRSVKDTTPCKCPRTQDTTPCKFAKAEERASKLEQEFEKIKRERDKALQRLEASEKELSEVRSNLAEIQRLLKEAWVRARKMDDELLQVVKALENARAELPRQAVDRYKESVGFKEGLKRMG